MDTAVRQINVGFLGAGYIADWHAVSLRTVKGSALLAVCDRDLSRARACATRHGVTRVYNSLGTMLKDGGLNSIHVLVPPELHAQTASQIVDARLDVLLEKPMGIAANECEELI